MADYINSNILSQSYVHVEPEWLATVKGKEKQEAIERIKNIIKQHAEERMKFFFMMMLILMFPLKMALLKLVLQHMVVFVFY